MKILRLLALSFSIYSKIPMPHFKNEDASGSLIFFPLVGAVIGGLIVLINVGMIYAGIPAAVRIILTIFIPLAITGGFHADGFMDTEDALNSYAGTERKLGIMKDPHIGSFAVISLIKWMLVYAAAVTAVLLSSKCGMNVLIILGLVFVASRCLCGLTSIVFRKAKREGMLYEETKDKERLSVCALTAFLITACALMLYMDLLCGAAVTAAFGVCTLRYRYIAYKEFGGVTGDTAGYFLTTSEIICTAALAVSLYLI